MNPPYIQQKPIDNENKFLNFYSKWIPNSKYQINENVFSVKKKNPKFSSPISRNNLEK